MDYSLYSTRTRRDYIATHLEGKYNFKEKGGYSLRDIAYDVKVTFGLEKAPSAATVKNDIDMIGKQDPASRELSDEAQRLLEPENFPEFRKLIFKAPGNKVYETPIHQLAWFHLIVTLALKTELPKWVIDYLEIKDLDINKWAENPERLVSLFLLAPPRHGKSDLLMHAMVWLILRNPDIRIIWCGGKLEISSLTTAFVKNELEANDFLIANYGPFENVNDWSNSSFTVLTRKTRMRAPTMTAVGKGSTILSMDADFIVVDDFVDLRSSESPTQVSKDARWLTTQLMTRREPWTPLMGIGSHQPSPTGDVYSLLNSDDDNEVMFVKIRAHDYTKCKPQKEGKNEKHRHGEHCMLWSSVRPYWFLEAQRKTLGDTMFEVCYNQDERQSRIEYFREKVVRGDYPTPVLDPEQRRYRDVNFVERTPGILDRNRSYGMVPHCCERGDKTLRVIGFDPAAGLKRGTSESALTVLTVCPECGRRYVVDTWHKRQSPEQHPETILNYVDFYRPGRVRIEINAYQSALARDEKLTSAQARKGFIIDEYTTSEKKHDPTMGIPVLSRHMESGKFSIPYMTPQDREKSEALIAQMIRWPQEPNDMIMSLWLAELSAQAYLTDYLYAVPEFYGDVSDIPQYLMDQVESINLSDRSVWE